MRPQNCARGLAPRPLRRSSLRPSSASVVRPWRSQYGRSGGGSLFVATLLARPFAPTSSLPAPRPDLPPLRPAPLLLLRRRRCASARSFGDASPRRYAPWLRVVISSASLRLSGARPPLPLRSRGAPPSASTSLGSYCIVVASASIVARVSCGFASLALTWLRMGSLAPVACPGGVGAPAPLVSLPLRRLMFVIPLTSPRRYAPWLRVADARSLRSLATN